MHRRALRTLTTVLLAALIAAFGAAPVAVAGVDDDAPPTTPPTTAPVLREPPVTIADDFFPESANLSDCVGFVERPGCGAEGRGGPQQTAIFVALAIGLGIIFWRIVVGVRRNRQQM